MYIFTLCQKVAVAARRGVVPELPLQGHEMQMYLLLLEKRSPADTDPSTYSSTHPSATPHFLPHPFIPLSLHPSTLTLYSPSPPPMSDIMDEDSGGHVTNLHSCTSLRSVDMLCADSDEDIVGDIPYDRRENHPFIPQPSSLDPHPSPFIPPSLHSSTLTPHPSLQTLHPSPPPYGQLWLRRWSGSSTNPAINYSKSIPFLAHTTLYCFYRISN